MNWHFRLCTQPCESSCPHNSKLPKTTDSTTPPTQTCSHWCTASRACRLLQPRRVSILHHQYKHTPHFNVSISKSAAKIYITVPADLHVTSSHAHFRFESQRFKISGQPRHEHFNSYVHHQSRLEHICGSTPSRIHPRGQERVGVSILVPSQTLKEASSSL